MGRSRRGKDSIWTNAPPSRRRLRRRRRGRRAGRGEGRARPRGRPRRTQASAAFPARSGRDRARGDRARRARPARPRDRAPRGRRRRPAEAVHEARKALKRLRRCSAFANSGSDRSASGRRTRSCATRAARCRAARRPGADRDARRASRVARPRAPRHHLVGVARPAGRGCRGARAAHDDAEGPALSSPRSSACASESRCGRSRCRRPDARRRARACVREGPARASPGPAASDHGAAARAPQADQGRLVLRQLLVALAEAGLQAPSPRAPALRRTWRRSRPDRAARARRALREAFGPGERKLPRARPTSARRSSARRSSTPQALPSQAAQARPAADARVTAPHDLVPVISRSRSNSADTTRQPSRSRTSSADPRPSARPSVAWITPKAIRMDHDRRQARQRR